MALLLSLLAVFDALALLAALAAVTIALTGGGTLDVFGHSVRAHSVGNPILAVAVWAVARYRCRQVPFLGLAALPLADVPEKSLSAVIALGRRLDAMQARRCALGATLVIGAGLVAKVVLVLIHPGFFSGDDVEIHEMTFKTLFATDWPIWELRSSFFPMAFIYPAQRMAVALGIHTTDLLVVVGRFVVVAISTATTALLYVFARRYCERQVAFLATAILASSALYIEFGATELPRPVASLFVFLAYVCLTVQSRVLFAVLSGILLGVATSLRFSEVVFLVPAGLQLAMGRSWKQLVWMILAFAVVCACIQAVADMLYWGGPFRSAVAMVDFTLIQRLSSRGYDPWWYYVREATNWSDVCVLSLAAYATRRNVSLALWVWMPIVALSFLPHKEPRYLIPILPELALLAALGLRALINDISSHRLPIAAAISTCLMLAVPLRFVDQVSKFRVMRSDAEVGFARQLVPWLTSESILVEQSWRFGGQLYLGRDRPVLDMGQNDFLGDIFRDTLLDMSPGLVLVSIRSCERADCVAVLQRLDFVEVMQEETHHLGYRAFTRSSGGR
jgi:hypothetical protein